VRNRIGANTWIWVSPPTDAALDELIPKIAEYGFGYVEIPIEHIGDWDPQRVGALARDHGLGITTCLVMPPGRELAFTDDVTRHETQEYLRAAIDATAAAGAVTICGPCYTSVGRTWRLDEADRLVLLDELTEALSPIADHAVGRGVTVALEPLNRFETSAFNTVDQAVELIDAVGSPGLGLAFDTFHANIEEKDPADAIRRAGRRLAHVQVCGNDRGAPGNDHIDWHALRRALDDVGYAGPLCIESFTADNQTIATAASVWRSFEGSQDAIATRGFAHLSKVFVS
jgi:D-psicose/D-tagatose/L-ribulose 3-epimerase